MHPWEWPDHPWARIHIDYAGPVKGKMILVIVDSHSKWIEAHVVNSATSQATIEKLRLVFSTYGLPEVIVSDNSTAFTSEEFTEFVRCNGIKHLTSAPYHPASNGLAERAVQTLKNALKKESGGVSLKTQILRFLFHYRITLSFSWAGDYDLILTSYTLISQKESEKDSWFKRRDMISLVVSEICQSVKLSGSGTTQLVVHGFQGLYLKSVVSRDSGWLWRMDVSWTGTLTMSDTVLLSQKGIDLGHLMNQSSLT